MMIWDVHVHVAVEDRRKVFPIIDGLLTYPAALPGAQRLEPVLGGGEHRLRVQPGALTYYRAKMSVTGQRPGPGCQLRLRELPTLGARQAYELRFLGVNDVKSKSQNQFISLKVPIRASGIL